MFCNYACFWASSRKPRGDTFFAYFLAGKLHPQVVMGAGVSVVSLDAEQFSALRRTYDVTKAAHTGEFTAEDEAALLAKLQAQLVDMGGTASSGQRGAIDGSAGHGHTEVGDIVKARIGSECSTGHGNIEVGDIVKARIGSKGIYYEGHVSGLDDDGMLEVEFDDGEVAHVAPGEVRKVLPWTVIEVGDTVKARHNGGYQRFDAVVRGVCWGAGGEPVGYDVEYDDGEVEEGVCVAHVDKVLSARVNTAVREWHKVHHMFQALKAMHGRGPFSLTPQGAANSEANEVQEAKE